MADEKKEKLDATDANDFESVETIEEVDVVEPAVTVDEKKEESLEAESPSGDELVMDAELVMEVDDETDISSADGSADKNVIDEDSVSVESMPELDDFDDLEEELAAVSVSSNVSKSSGGAGKVAVGLIALLAAGAGGYYFLSSSPQGSEIPVVSSAPVVEAVADAVPTENNVSVAEDVITDVAEVDDFAADELSIDEDNVVMEDSVEVDSNAMDELSMMGETPEEVDAEDIISLVEETPQDEVVEGQEQEMLSVTVDEQLSVSEEDAAVTDDEILLDVEQPEPVMDDVAEIVEVVNEDPVVEGIIDDVEVAPVEDGLEVLTVSPAEEVLIEVEDEASVAESNIDVPVKPDVYFDSVENVIQRDSSLQSTGPSEVDPIAEPASKYLVVTEVKSKNSVESQIQQARRALKLGRYDAAYDFYERLYQKNPKDEAILMGRAVSLQKLGRNTAAISAYEELLNLHPKNADALVNMLGLVKGQYPAVALQKLLSIRQDHPQNAGVAAQIGLTYAAMNNFNDAKRYLNIAMGIEPNNALHLYNMAVVFDREGSRDRAVEFYDKALRVDAVHGGGRSINREVVYDRLTKLR